MGRHCANSEVHSTGQTLLAGCEYDYPPFCIVHPDGRVDGFSVELLRAALKVMGRDLAFRTGSWNEVKGWLESGEVAVLPLVGRTPERETLFDFTVPYLTMHGAIVVRKDVSDVRDLNDLWGRRVGVMKGDNAEEFLRREERGVNLLTFPTFSNALQQLSAGRCDAVVIQRLVALRLLAEKSFTNLRILDRPIHGFSQSFCFAVREGDRDTLAILNEGLALVVADGTHRHLHTKWFASLELPSDRPIIIGGDYNYPPFEYLDANGRPAGFTVEMTRAIARAMNLNIQFQLTSWPKTVDALRAGEIDAIQGMFYSAERDQVFDFSPRYLVIHCVSVVRQGTGPPPASLPALAGRDLVIQGEDAVLEMLREAGIQAQITTVPTQEEVVRAVADGRHDCGLVIRLGALHAIKHYGWTNVVLGDQAIYSGDYCYAVPRGHAALMAQLSEGLQALKQTGEYRAIHEKWLGVYEPAPPTWRTALKYIVWIASPLLVIALLASIWSWNLRRLVAQRTTDLASTNQELQETIKELRRAKVALDHVPACIYIKDRNRRYVYANRVTLQLFKCSANELKGSTDHRFFPPATVDRLHEIDTRILEHGQDTIEEIESVAADGSRRVYWEIKTPLYEDDSKSVIWGLCGISTDITARKKAEEHLRLSEERFRRAIQDSPFPIMLHAEGGEVLQLSHSWCELAGFAPDQLRSLDDWTLHAFNDAASIAEARKATLQDSGQGQYRGDLTLRAGNGTTRIWDFSSAPLGSLPDGRRLVISMAVDVTERRTAEASLQATRVSLLSLIEDQREAQEQVRQLNLELEHRVQQRTLQLEEANRELEAFSYSVSHDLRAPLRHISGYVGLLRRAAEPVLNETARRHLQTIADAAAEMGALIDDLLAFSRVGRSEIRRVNLHLNDFVQQVVRVVERDAGDRKLVWKIAPLPQIEADPELLRSVLINLLSNAVKYTRTRNQAIIEIGWEARDGENIFFVRDNGVGFDMLYVSKLFGVFQRLHTTSEFEGTGIGLANVRRIISRHGGRTWATGAVDQGATFFFSLPISA